MPDPDPRPVELHVERSKHLKIRWADGHESVIPLRDLRKACPCAPCAEARRDSETNPLAVKEPEHDVQAMTTVDSAALVGNYALQIRWKDGHDAGIYPFGLLRSLG